MRGATVWAMTPLFGVQMPFVFLTWIIARKLFSYSLQGVDEIGGYVVAITGTFGFAYALINRTHTRIEPVTCVLERLLQ